MIKGKKYLKKQVVASVLALSMAAASLTGCSNGLSSSKKESSNVGTMTQEEASTTKVMVIGDYDIYMEVSSSLQDLALHLLLSQTFS